MEYEEILNRFNIDKSSGNKAQCTCPAHSDKQASLSIKYEPSEGKTLIYCQARCDTRDVLAQVGLTLSDLFDEQLEKKPIKKEDVNIEKIYKYTDDDGSLLFEKVRTKDKHFSQRRIINGTTVWGLDEGEYSETFDGSNQFSKKDRPTKKQYFPLQKPILYNLPKVIEAIANDTWIFIAEGEKDCDTLNAMGFVATTGSSGAGKGKWLDRYSQYFKGATVVIFPDNDEPGKKYAEEIRKSIKKYCYSVKIVMTSNIEKGDITDWSQIEGNNREKLLQIIKEQEREFPPWYEQNEKTKGVKLVKGLLKNNLIKNMDYIIAGSSSSKGLMHIYRNGVYKLASQNWICSEISKYIIPRLQNSGNINDIAEMLTYKEPVNFDDINGKEDIINLKNGLYNIKTKELKPHSKDYISCYQLNCEYKNNIENLRHWDSFIDTLSNGSKDVQKVLQEYAGLTLSNITGNRVKKVLLLLGKGDTGKSKYIEALCRIVGEENSINLKMQQLSDRFSLSAIYGKRIVFNGDLPNSTLDDPSTLKEITGGDALSAEFKGKDKFMFTYKGVLIFACNNLPYVKGDTGQHLFDRFLIVPCNNVIPVEQRDPLLIEKLMEDKDHILQWALEGLERLIKQNYRFTKAQELEEQKEKYMLRCDSTRAFIKENYTVTGLALNKVKASNLYIQYENYCNHNEDRACSSKKFTERLENNLGILKRKSHGLMYFNGISKNDIKLVTNKTEAWEEINGL